MFPAVRLPPETGFLYNQDTASDMGVARPHEGDHMDTKRIKENLRRYYAPESALRDAIQKDAWKRALREGFLRKARAEGKTTLLELGAGPGQDSRFFMDGGLRVTAVDLSPEMVALCRQMDVGGKMAFQAVLMRKAAQEAFCQL